MKELEIEGNRSQPFKDVVLKSSWLYCQGRSREMARSLFAADLLPNSSLSGPCQQKPLAKNIDLVSFFGAGE